MKKRLPIVALVGRQNVGKSTLFNTFIGTRKAIVSPVRGTTRDRNMAEMEWRDTRWQLVDTGGIEHRPESVLSTSVRAQAEATIKKADLVCFVVDGRQELTPDDLLIARMLRASAQRVLLVVNKVDNERLRRSVSPDFHKLGFGETALISAKNGAGVGDLLDRITAVLPRRETDTGGPTINVILLGKPNVGKSSLTNALVNEERVIVTPEPHTTRDPQDMILMFEGQRYRLVDTAGIRKAANLRATIRKEHDAKIEQTSVLAGLRELERADIAAVVLDCSEPVTSQDRHILHIVLESNAGLMLILNKWDKIPEKTTATIRDFTLDLTRSLPFLAGVPVIYTSATSGMRVFDILRTAKKIDEAKRRTIPDDTLHDFMREHIWPRWPLRKAGGKIRNTFTMKQVGTNPPIFRVTIGPKQELAEAQKRFLHNQLRDVFGLAGVPIRIRIEKKLRR